MIFVEFRLFILPYYIIWASLYEVKMNAGPSMRLNPEYLTLILNI